MTNRLADMWLDLRGFMSSIDPETPMTAKEVLEVMVETEQENA